MNREGYKRMAEEYREQIAVLATRRDKLIHDAKDSAEIWLKEEYAKRYLVLDREIEELTEAAATILKYAEA